MRYIPTGVRSLLPRHLLLVSRALLSVAAGAARAADDRQQVTDQMRADCGAEGEAGGLVAAVLEA